MYSTFNVQYELSFTTTAEPVTVTTKCSTITFDNAGTEPCNIYFYSKGNGHITLLPGKSITFGNNPNAILVDDFTLAASSFVGYLVNIIKETHQILT